MSNLFKAILLLAILFNSNTVFAQKDWRWDKHGIAFSAPSNMKVTTNNAEEFAAEGSDLFLSLYAEQDSEVTEETLAEVVVAAAVEMEYDEITDVDALSIQDFKGFYVEGTKDGIGAVIIALLDEKSSTNLIISIAYTTDAARNKAIAIANSFYAFD